MGPGGPAVGLMASGNLKAAKSSGSGNVSLMASGAAEAGRGRSVDPTAQTLLALLRGVHRVCESAATSVALVCRNNKTASSCLQGFACGDRCHVQYTHMYNPCETTGNNTRSLGKILYYFVRKRRVKDLLVSGFLVAMWEF